MAPPLADRMALHALAAALAAGVGGAYSLPSTSLDPTLASADAKALVGTIWAAHQSYYAALLAALADPGWAAPVGPPAPAKPPAPAPAPAAKP
jgi:hypothetical protein